MLPVHNRPSQPQSQHYLSLAKPLCGSTSPTLNSLAFSVTGILLSVGQVSIGAWVDGLEMRLVFAEEGLQARSPDYVEIVGVSEKRSSSVLTMKLMNSCQSSAQQNCVQFCKNPGQQKCIQPNAMGFSFILEPAVKSFPRIYCEEPASPLPPSPAPPAPNPLPPKFADCYLDPIYKIPNKWNAGEAIEVRATAATHPSTAE